MPGSTSMLDVWLNRTRTALSTAEKLLPLGEQEFAAWAISRQLQHLQTSPTHGKIVTICGEAGSGKTALIHQAIRHGTPQYRRSIVIAEAREWVTWCDRTQETGQFSLTTSANNMELIVCENLQLLSDPLTQGDLLAKLFDLAREALIPVVVTCDCLPSQISHLSPRLLNRLQGGLLTSIRPLSFENQQRLWDHWSSLKTNLKIRPLSKGMSLIATAGQLRHHWQSIANSPQSPLQPKRRVADPVSLDLLAEMVAAEFQVSLADLRSGSRTQILKIPRGVAMTLARELTQQPLTSISRYFGCRSHTSVVRGCSRLQQLLPEAPTLRQQILQLRAKLCRELSRSCG